MEVKINNNGEMLDATIEMVEGVMVVSPKEVKFEPKDGDVCCSANCVYIYKSLRDDKAIIYYCAMAKNGAHITIKEDVGVGFLRSDWHCFATEEEKKKLFDKLKEEGYEFDFEKKKLIKLKWKPKNKEYYFRPILVNAEVIVHRDVWFDELNDIAYYNKGLVFRTKEECEQFCSKLNKAIEGVKP